MCDTHFLLVFEFPQMLLIPYPELLFLRAKGIYSYNRMEAPNIQNMVLSIFNSECKAICRIMKILEFLVKWELLEAIQILKKVFFFLSSKWSLLKTNYFLKINFLWVFSVLFPSCWGFFLCRAVVFIFVLSYFLVTLKHFLARVLCFNPSGQLRKISFGRTEYNYNKFSGLN